MKRKSYTLFTLVSVFMMLMAQPVLAASTPQLSASADAASVNKGKTVKVKISLKNNPKISTLGLVLNYDADAFQYGDCSWNSALGGNDMKMASDSQGSVNLSLVCDSSYQEDGAVATVSFKAKKDVNAVDMTLQLREISDENLSDVENCKVTKSVHVPEAAEDNSKKETAEENNAKETVAKQSTQKNSEQAAAKEVKSVSTAKAANTASTKLDDNYKTGVNVGEDLLFIIAIACGSIAAIILIERKIGTLN